MFDANMRHLKIGTTFYAKVNGCRKKSTLYAYGVRYGNILRCKMMETDNNHPIVAFEIGDEVVEYKERSDYDLMMTFQGVEVDGVLADFINDVSLKAAKKILAKVKRKKKAAEKAAKIAKVE